MNEKKTKEEKEEGGEKTAGGSSPFNIKNTPITIPESEPDNQEGEEETEGESTPASEVQQQINAAMVETACMVVGNIAKLVTNIDEIAFDEDETNQLVELWSPIMPQLTPVVAAIIGTSIIIGGKVGVYYTKKKELKSGEEETKGKKPKDSPI